MKIQIQDLYHGAVLSQISEHPSFHALKKVDSEYGHYLVNQDTRLFVKYLTKKSSPWNFKFSVSEMQSIQHVMKKTNNVFLCLVCGQETICALNKNELRNLINLNSAETQYIIVEVPTGGSMHVKGTTRTLERTLRHNSFPGKLFEETLELSNS
ncbi:hypothetical protein NSA56_10135 [Oceanobacillus caeni]|uniref:Uncharacterized protein n=1 Tax=Oceanobacillus caeni TaxID=405946 RepID=A0ABR5ML01_9BACI|nr:MULTISPECIES: hypothetical protein [Bacillaceae]KKE80045.1 hypothetical protein WH51_03755 [Bacilli bacterium VT-13-104]PZD86432.1 hypothetical protein DEJ64_07605 [Bacilli bacterium]KPH76556.1 hypothetical protein AFL42_05580 [Oceanobacillus caeni]MBU8791517.1 hypothetical protein [Oceanobacillus caeni]MCR1834757.1 hypothetical protein [Oceanobacillus caeni]